MANGVRITRVRHFVPGSQDVVRRGLYEASFYAGARTAVRRHRPDLVLGVTPSLAGAAAAAALSERHRVPLGVVVQDLVGLGARQSGIRGGVGLAHRIASLEAGVLRRADRLAIITGAFRRPLVERGVDPHRIDLLPNYTHVEASTASRVDARRVLGWPLDRPIAVHAGNMGLKQGLDTVVEAARLADRRGSDLLVMLVGDGNTRRDLEQRGAGLSTLRFIDPLPADRFPFALAAADCLLLNERATVRDMSMPSKLTSYLAAGRPVVAATHPAGAAAIELRRAGAGLVVDAGDPQAVLAAVERVLDDPALATRLATTGRTYAMDNLSRSAARRRIVDFVGRTSTETPTRTASAAAMPPTAGAGHPFSAGRTTT